MLEKHESLIVAWWRAQDTTTTDYTQETNFLTSTLTSELNLEGRGFK